MIYPETSNMLKNKVLQAFMWGGILLAFGCNGGGQSGEDQADADSPKIDSTESSILQVGNKLFNVPSPIEMAMLIKETENTFTPEWLHDPGEVSAYNTKFQQAINLGVYSADLGYTLCFGESNNALKYLAVCRDLGTELSIPQEYFLDLFQRFEGNMGNPDSLTIFMARAYQISDAYLKANESEDVSTLILTGGWIESFYYASQVAKSESGEAVRMRIGEQKGSLENILELLKVFQKNEEFATLIGDLKELHKLFKDIEYNYTYVEPTTDTVNQITVINSTSETKISMEQLNAITEKVEAIRKGIIQ